MQYETLPDWLEWLEQQHSKSIDLGLDRVAIVAQRLNLLSFNATVITVAGTNGKGSFVASLAAILQAHGKRVGSYTSPHFLLFNERINLNGLMASDNELIGAFDEVYKCCQDISLTYFEFTTLAAFYLFRQHDFDQLILEVGLGGRLDAVNIIDPDYAVITSIGIDHQEYLGDSREKIAYEKCGILRKNKPMISAEIDPPEFLVHAIDSHQGLQIGKDFSYVKQGNNWSFQSSTLDIELHNIIDNGLSIPSQSAAICVAQQILGSQFQTDLIVPVLNQLSLPGRFQQIDINGITIILDVAHNVQAAMMLHNRLLDMSLAAGNKRFAVFNMLNDKDVDSIIDLMSHIVDKWFIGDIDHPRATTVQMLEDLLIANNNTHVDTSNNIKQAFDRAQLQCRAGDQIVIFGSFYVVAELLPLLGKL